MAKIASALERLGRTQAAAGSPALSLQESAQWAGEWSDAGVEINSGVSGMCAMAADHIRSFAILGKTERSILGVATQARASLAAMAQIDWIYTQGIEPAERVRRWANRRLVGSAEMRNLLLTASEPVRTKELQNQQEFEECIRRSAALLLPAENWTPSKNRGDWIQPARIGEAQLGEMKLVDALLHRGPDKSSDVGIMLYRFLSASVHGQPHVTVPNLVGIAHDPNVPGLNSAGFALENSDYLTWAIALLLGFANAAESLIGYLALDAPWLQALAQDTLALFRSQL
ncbi:hypothetical protein FB461_0056 [Rarobacter faecitabidus]|uniref:Uncharacterized protein n=2 Tax=Rarobacter faecitabidus TaxID=13243 RepID=A0A542ZTB0_RARFA|nr:hypothetical protein FB461_0056 [Rarobacter faecitabidus]